MTPPPLSALPEELPTAIPEVRLRLLTPADTADHLALLRANRDHVTRHGDFTEQVRASAEDVRAALARTDGRERAYGIRLRGALVGQVSLIAVDPPRYGLGYWLDHGATGHGRAGAACAALVDRAHTVLGATDVFAGVTHGNTASAALLRRLGFAPVREFATYTRFRLALPPVA
ncbi:GNAT family N-acetyltransferase [Nocardiopsis alborubida]|uniref:GNAT family N-acetyltransferase n=1 Tax=Nocardiopsis alborubida TaxID=146802 RepID=A0A7X6RQX5_9ACTN|nr:GNAT family N-acetyltransferase [Nocardiopsis alborubida]NKY99234.1 GNAT family N-acetyltransferase [Nocardiopsis alborubida]